MVVAKPKDYSNMIGQIYYNSQGTLFKVLCINNTSDALIEFQDKYKIQKHTHLQNIKSGAIKNPYDITAHGVGFLGDGPYKMSDSKGKHLPAYSSWRSILERCYSDSLRYRNPTYEDCECCEEWFNFQTFARWYYDNFYQTGTGRMHIDKDIKIKRNRLYAPDRCIFVPQKINMLFMSKSRKDGLPTGVSLAESKRYYASYGGVYLGAYMDAESAAEAHLFAKRLHIKNVVESFGNELPEDVREILLAW